MARLAQGVRKRADGILEKRFTVDGKRYSAYGVTNKELQRKEKEIRKMIEEGTYTNNRHITLSEYFKEWEQGRKGVVKDSSARITRYKYNAHIAPVFGDRRIQSLEKREIIKFQQDLAKRMKPTSVTDVVNTLKSILNSAVADDIISKSPAAGIKPLRTDSMVKASETIHRALTKEEETLFLNASKNEWLYEFFCFSLCTGMRIMEIGALQWKDIDYINNVIHVTKTLSIENKDKIHVTPPKSESSKRDIPMNDTIKQILKMQREKMLLLYGADGVRMESRIFVSQYGKVVSSATFNGVAKRIFARLEQNGTPVEKFSHHAFRDTFATRYIQNGGTLQTLKTILGHSSFAMTADLYAHVMPNTKQDEMNLIEKGFQGVV